MVTTELLLCRCSRAMRRTGRPGVHRCGVHPLIDDQDLEGVGGLARRHRDVGVGHGSEVDPVLGILLLDPIAHVLGAGEVTCALDRDGQLALVSARDVRRWSSETVPAAARFRPMGGQRPPGWGWGGRPPGPGR